MKILIIDDQESVVKRIRDFSIDKGWSCQVIDFSQFDIEIDSYNPDVIVLDWKDDAGDFDAGDPILHKILEDSFRPVIVFSGFGIPEIEATKNNSLVYGITKSDEEDVIKLIEKLEPYITSINEMRSQMNNALIESTKAIYNFIETDMGTAPTGEIIKYMLNKRASQFFDNNLFPGEKPPAWIKFEYPPISDNLLVADIIRKISVGMDCEKTGAPEEYSIILTPSCDMARATGERSIVIAKAINKNQYNNGQWVLTEQQTLDSRKGQEKVSKVVSTLGAGYNASQIPIAELPGKIPYMAIELKKIETIPISKIAFSADKIDSEANEYYRVASIISPFREQIVWAYMNNACRPGVPDRDFEEWAKGMVSR